MNLDCCFSSNTVEWETPQNLFDKLNEEFHFDLDPCSTHENAKCKKHYTKEQNGLLQDWGGTECSAILHMAEKKQVYGLKNVLRKVKKKRRWLLCLYQLEQIRNGFMNIFTDMLKLDLLKVA